MPALDPRQETDGRSDSPDLLAELRQCAVELEEAANILHPHFKGMATIYDQAAIRVMATIRRAT